MKKFFVTLALLVCIGAGLATAAFAQELVVGGQALGIEMSTQGAIVDALSTVMTAEGEKSPAKDAGICEGDVIVGVSGQPVDSAGELIALIASLQGESAELELLRRGESARVTVEPALSSDGRWMLGLMLRDEIAGIGTLTYFDPDTGAYGALGHCVSDGESGAALPLHEGSIRSARIRDVVKGEDGKPGELDGSVDGACIGSIERNTPYGIYGHMSLDAAGDALPTGEVSLGSAGIISTVDDGGAREYAVEISRIFHEAGETRFLLTVTDETLCGLTGGIVQGMSGSPVVQNGKLVGAVTHVFVSDPTKGYGLSIQDMLDAAA